METYHITERSVIGAVAGVIYQMAPGRAPRQFDKIITHIRQYLKDEYKKRDGKGDYIYFLMPHSELNKFFHDMLFGCQEFLWLNISQCKWDNGQRELEDGWYGTFVGHDDDGVPCTVTSIAEYNDFIDLDAALGNIVGQFCYNEQGDKDCFLCKYAKKYKSMEPSDCEQCRHCTLHPKNACNFETDPRALKHIHE